MLAKSNGQLGLLTLSYNGKQYHLSKKSNVIGSGQSVDVRINDSMVAKTQAEINVIQPPMSGKQNSTMAKVRPTVTLKVIETKPPMAQVFVNGSLVVSSKVLKNGDRIEFGRPSRHSLVVAIRPVEVQPSDVNRLTTPAKTSKMTSNLAKCRNLIPDFDSSGSALLLLSSQCTPKQPLPRLPPPTPSSVRIQRLLKENANAKKAISPSVWRYFQRFNSELNKEIAENAASPLDREQAKLLVPSSTPSEVSLCILDSHFTNCQFHYRNPFLLLPK